MMKVKNVIIMVLVLIVCFASCDMHSYIVKEKILPLDYKGICKSYKEYNPDTEIVFEREKTSTVLSKEEVVKKFVWAYIPHLFYTPFYVYQYATSFAASFKLYKDVKEGKEGAFDRYIGLLSSGGSKYPMEQAKLAGVDFTQKETFMAVVERMDYLLKELEELLK